MSTPRPATKKTTTQSPPALWWEALDEECPITLEPLSSLPYPPFELGGGKSNYYDGVALASYMVSRGLFENPLTREPLHYSDCKRLDDYVKTYHPQDTRMAVCCEAFMLSQTVKISSDVPVTWPSCTSIEIGSSCSSVSLFVYGRNNNSKTDQSSTAARNNEPAWHCRHFLVQSANTNCGRRHGWTTHYR